ncbi:hypothetical protein [Helicobacter cynogastricus]|uniref:hypothetical protein n=1 Tax=Helicobacter cynogastricus TaxID=329937 RepID=UPI000CF13543|nr:hypothetical protein [Helicobacter cynogastricus]
MIFSVPTAKGIEVLSAEFQQEAKKYLLVGADTTEDAELDRLIGRNPDGQGDTYVSELEFNAIENYVYYEGTIDIARYDEQRYLTFEINLGKLNTDKYVYACLIVDDAKNILAVVPLAKVVLNAHVGGVLVIKFSVVGRQPGELVFLNRDFPSYQEWTDFKAQLNNEFAQKTREFEAQKTLFTNAIDAKMLEFNTQKDTFTQKLTELESSRANLAQEFASTLNIAKANALATMSGLTHFEKIDLTDFVQVGRTNTWTTSFVVEPGSFIIMCFSFVQDWADWHLRFKYEDDHNITAFPDMNADEGIHDTYAGFFSVPYWNDSARRVRVFWRGWYTRSSNLYYYKIG